MVLIKEMHKTCSTSLELIAKVSLRDSALCCQDFSQCDGSVNWIKLSATVTKRFEMR